MTNVFVMLNRGIDFLRNLVGSTPIPPFPFPYLPSLSPSPVLPSLIPPAVIPSPARGSGGAVSSPSGVWHRAPASNAFACSLGWKSPLVVIIFRRGEVTCLQMYPCVKHGICNFASNMLISSCGRLQHLSKTWPGPLMGWTKIRVEVDATGSVVCNKQVWY